MDTSWIDLRNGDPAYYSGCLKFMELAKETLVEGKTRCPCNKCKLNKWHFVEEVGGHILLNGFLKKYRNWVFHRKVNEGRNSFETPSGLGNAVGQDDMGELLRAAFCVDNSESHNESQGMPEDEVFYDMHEEFDFHCEVDNEFPSSNSGEEDAKCKRLMEAADEVLYEGCTTFSKLSFILHLFHLKCMFHWSAESFTKLLELLIDAFPQNKEFSSSYYEGKKIVNDLGLGYEKIDACPNNCILYWGVFADKDGCHVCHTSRWKTVKEKEDNKSEKGKKICKKGEPAKVMRYFSLIPRLKRLYMSSKTAKDMRWHFEHKDDKILRHPSDGEAWKSFDKRYVEFAEDPRSVRLGLASDGFNPYRLMNTNYSTWPVILIPYNLPPWLCMKPSSFILSLLIPGKHSPGMDIDVYLQPLIHELKLLWEGIPAFDAHSGNKFKMQAALHSTINDFPAYAMLSGWSTRGVAPVPASGIDILKEVEKVKYVYGQSKKAQPKKISKKRKRLQGGTSHDEPDDDDGGEEEANVIWKKKRTLLDMDKSRDDKQARRALKDKNIKSHLWPQSDPNRVNDHLPPAEYTMSTEEKERFLRVIEKLKVPDGYGSNLQRCVNIKQRKLINLKSHDNHVLMQDILPIALRASNATKVIDLLEELSDFFKNICSTTIHSDDLDTIQSKLVLTLCKLEKAFLPIFFTIMVHLLIHLVDEVKLGGPVQYRWMYPIERYLAFLKSHVSNKAQPEGSIAEGYLLWETITFCSRYLESVETIFTRPKRNEDGVLDNDTYLYHSGCRVVGKQENVRLDDKSLRQIHRYVLLHSDEMKPIIDAFICQKRHEDECGGSQSNEIVENGWIINEFPEWLRNQAYNIDVSTTEGKLRKALAGGLSNYSKKLKSVIVNGYKFDTVERERFRKTQNSGVFVEADGQEYYGRLQDIFELNYYGSFKVIMFRCEWVDIHRGLKTNPNGSVRVNFSKLMHTGRNLHDDPFVFSSQAKQCFYIEDEIQQGWSHVVKTKPRDFFDIGDDEP
ncbi:uncharacterized protein [Spinacia oleracea]|uniref:Transposase-associated domain-containing protein n=1 Tax=Spinacia oleracea TaxID=3562 RepID=A0A9R0IQP4_SPIOL|nr:uncharacterized protein LOC110792745 [Spinacia oleracea]